LDKCLTLKLRAILIEFQVEVEALQALAVEVVQVEVVLLTQVEVTAFQSGILIMVTVLDSVVLEEQEVEVLQARER
jgi:hypothetical protein